MRGFTLIELLVTVAIAAILVAIAIPLFAKYTNRAYRATVISDVRNAQLSTENFINEYRVVPDSVTCPNSGYGPATCDLQRGSNVLTSALVVSKNVRVSLSRVSCGGDEGYKIHGVHTNLPGWGYCFDACAGVYVETDGSGCP